MNKDIFEKMPVPKAYFKLAFPVVFSMVISLVYNMVDTYFIAQTNQTSLIAGVALSAPVFTLMIALGDIWGLGGSSVIARLFGKGDYKAGRKISAFCFYASILCGVVIAALMLLLRTPLLKMLGADTDTFRYASDYYTWIALGAPAIIFSFTPSNLLRTEGLAKEAMLGSIIGSVVNIILDPIFISTLGMGAKGAAIATVLGNVCADIYYIYATIYRSKNLSAKLSELQISMKQFGEIFAIGIPASITNLMQSIGIAVGNLFLLQYGNLQVASMGIVMKINMIAVLILVGFSFGGQPLMGYNYGAKNKKRLREILQFSYGFEVILGGVMTVILSMLAPVLMKVFTQKEDLIACGVPMLRFQLISMFAVAIVMVTTCMFQSAGKAAGAFILSVSRQGVIYILCIFGLNEALGYVGVLAAQPVADILTAVVSIVLLKALLGKELRKEKKTNE